MLIKPIILSSFIVGSLGFLDTGSVWSNKQLTDDYIIANEQLIKLMEGYCSNGIQIYQNKDNGKINNEIFKNFNEIKHVKYDDLQDVNGLFTACNGEIENIENIEILENLENLNNDKLIIIQNIPKFNEDSELSKFLKSFKHHQHKGGKETIKVYNELRKRDENGELIEQLDEDLEESILEEIKQDFEAAESMIANEGDDEIVHILDNQDVTNTKINTKTTSNVNGSLFHRYQFFSPGIFSGLIVAFSLLFILLTGLNWLSSIEISYKSFDKVVDYEKKNE